MPILDAHSFEFISRSPEQTRRIGIRLGSSLQAGDVICLSGELGAGKTTLLKAILGMVKADTGSIKLNGESIDQLPTHKRVEKGIAMAAAAFGTLHKMTVENNLKMGAYYINDKTLLMYFAFQIIFDIFCSLF